MKKFAFISRHEPNADQKSLASKAGIEIVHVGDRDAFSLNMGDFSEFDGVVVVHAVAAMKALRHCPVGIFNNVNRAPEGAKPQFGTDRLYIYQEVWKRGVEIEYTELEERVFAI